MSPYETLRLAEGETDLAVIRRAYATALRAHPPETDPAGFRAIRDAYEHVRQVGLLRARSEADPLPSRSVTTPISPYAPPGDVAIEPQVAPRAGPARRGRDEAGIHGEPADASVEGASVGPAGTAPPAAAPHLRDGEEALASGTLGDQLAAAERLLSTAGIEASEGVSGLAARLAWVVAFRHPHVGERLTELAWRAAGPQERPDLDTVRLDLACEAGRALGGSADATAYVVRRILEDVPADEIDAEPEFDAFVQDLYLQPAGSPFRRWLRRVAPDLELAAELRAKRNQVPLGGDEPEAEVDEDAPEWPEPEREQVAVGPPGGGGALLVLFLFLLVMAVSVIIASVMAPARTQLPRPAGQGRSSRDAEAEAEARRHQLGPEFPNLPPSETHGTGAGVDPAEGGREEDPRAPGSTPPRLPSWRGGGQRAPR